MKTISAVIAILAALAAPPAASDAVPGTGTDVFESSGQRVDLLELYTSQGCSSCPPAERWLGDMRDDDGLWTRVVPVAFHVDYWDYLGWEDRFGSSRHSQRQRDYAASWGNGRVYTPGFVVNGVEWRGWFEREPLPAPQDDAGRLQCTASNGVISAVSFEPARLPAGGIEAHVALLGFDYAVDVKKGENRGSTLLHDFVVLQYDRVPLRSAGEGIVSTADELKLGADKKHRAKRYALAVWVTQQGDSRVIQATGGWLSTSNMERIEMTENKNDDSDQIVRSEDEWRDTLTPEQYQVTREKGTERAFTGEYWDNKDTGVYLCVACGLPLFASDTKYESGSGWPSFWEPVKGGNIKEESDRSLGMVRVEVLCKRCEAHLGHLFEDGPRPTGLRYCINSAALKFVPKDEGKESK